MLTVFKFHKAVPLTEGHEIYSGKKMKGNVIIAECKTILLLKLISLFLLSFRIFKLTIRKEITD